MVTKNKFISQKNRHHKFTKMVDRIAEITDLDPKYIRKTSEHILNDWEARNHKELQNLFTVNERTRHQEIHKMATQFQRTFEHHLDPQYSRILLKKIGFLKLL